MKTLSTQSKTVAYPFRLDLADFHHQLYQGEIFELAEHPAMQKIVIATRQFLEAHFYPHDPELIHTVYDHAALADQFDQCRRHYQQLPEIKQLWLAFYQSLGMNPAFFAADRVILRFHPPAHATQDYTPAPSTMQIAPHRDTWGSNFFAQVNWWAPVYTITAERCFSIAPEAWHKVIKNNSAEFDLNNALEKFKTLGNQAMSPDSLLPVSLEPYDLEQACRVVIQPGNIIAFSGHHLHAGLPNTTDKTRISLDTRSLSIDDFQQGLGAPNQDGKAPHIALHLFKRLSDGLPLNDLLQLPRQVALTNLQSIKHCE